MASKCRPGETVREHYAHGGKISDPLPDEDLTTPEHLLHSDRLSLFGLTGNAEDLAGKIAGSVVRTFRSPENLAGLSGSLLLPLIVFRGRRPPLLPWLAVAIMGEYGGRMAWRAGQDLRTIARAAEANAMFPGKPNQ